MSQRAAVTKAKATAYARADRVRKTQILDELVELTRWHRDYARAALRQALVLKIVTPRTPRGPTYDPRVMTALITCWAVLRAPAGKRLAPMLPTLVPILRRDGELDLTDAEADLLCPRCVWNAKGHNTKTVTLEQMTFYWSRMSTKARQKATPDRRRSPRICQPRPDKPV